MRYIVLSLCLIASLLLLADMPVGEWRYYNNYGVNQQRVIDAGGKVYYVCDGNLFGYDKKIGETYAYNHINGLSDVNVSDIYYHDGLDLLGILYANGNIDFLNSAGDIFNVSDIKVSSRLSSRSLNDVAFSGNDCYVAGDFGIVRIDLKSFLVKESAVLGKPVTGITVIGDMLFISTAGKIKCKAPDLRLSDITRYADICDMDAVAMESVGDGLIVVTDGKRTCILNYNPIAGTLSKKELSHEAPYLIRSHDRVIAGSDKEYSVIGADGMARHYTVPDELKKEGNIRYHSIGDNGEMWYINFDGLGHFNAYGDIDMLPVRPHAAFLDDGAWYITPDPVKGNIYVSNRSSRNDLRYYNENGPMSISMVDNGFVSNITPVSSEVTLRNPNSGARLKTGFTMAVDREEEGVMYIGTWWEGIFKFKDGRQIDKYDWINMPLNLDYILAFPAVAVDMQNNLWCYGYNAKGEVKVLVLPASRRRQGNVSAADWIVMDIDGFGAFDARNTIILPCASIYNKDIVLISDGYRDNNLVTYHTAGTIETLSDDRYNVRNIFYDQDGKSFGPVCIFSMAEDKEGAVWVGTDNGVFVIRHPADMLDENCPIERVKVSRDDGTDYADYLLGNMNVTAVSVDGSNRKWLGTGTAGVYLVSADGKEIIAHFDTENSYLPSDEVLSLLCDPEGNSVYIGTREGVTEYGSDALPAAEDYSEVYAYPNPVRPSYRGDIVIKGLMDDSLVKIADAAGNVIYQCHSHGGMATWNGCMASGRRVASGVYFVLVSASGSSNESVVTKILVVN